MSAGPLTIPLQANGQPDVTQFETDIATHLDEAIERALYLELNIQPADQIAAAWARVSALKALSA